MDTQKHRDTEGKVCWLATHARLSDSVALERILSDLRRMVLDPSQPMQH